MVSESDLSLKRVLMNWFNLGGLQHSEITGLNQIFLKKRTYEYGSESKKAVFLFLMDSSSFVQPTKGRVVS